MARVQLLAPEVPAHSPELASGHGDMNRSKESVEVAQRQLADAQSPLLAVEGEHDNYRRCLGIE